MLNELFGDLGRELGDLRGDVRRAIHGGDGRHQFRLMAGYCTPKRSVLTGLFKKYGIKGAHVTEELEKNAEGYPLFYYLTATVNTTQARWAEYLILRSGKFTITNALYDERNRQWANKGGMPKAWSEGKPWIETSCSEGMKAWQPLRDAARKGRK